LFEASLALGIDHFHLFFTLAHDRGIDCPKHYQLYSLLVLNHILPLFHYFDALFGLLYSTIVLMLKRTRPAKVPQSDAIVEESVNLLQSLTLAFRHEEKSEEEG